jgi:hypothetical protein
MQFHPLTVTIKISFDSNGDSKVDNMECADHRPSFSARSIASAASRKALGITWEYKSIVIGR